ncbi:precorrin-2 C(20)-methyltransferase [Parabacteroides sp. AD58]|uniref:Precorrin-2 C(20)-methyltransferase n=1 Tax=Parabacteroides absconsus TaxID=2951805 RepID=A0ABZ2IQE9_9BACT|nr:precorrin-2 C(20)-methyltransferase [Parabacteroides sp. AD58]MCM6902342.1 precorrin-2 C(20)-methyltransferase [Parabacteroides sp. AD58]
MNRTITFVSLGPGEPELITVKGLKTLQQADQIFCPATLTPSGKQVSRAANILKALEIEEHKIRPFVLPMSKDRQKAIEAYDQLLVDAAGSLREGKKVVIVAEGDAGFYTSIQYIYHQLEKEHIEVRRVPGIPAFIAAGATGGLHIVKQEERLMVIPGTATADELAQFIRQGYNLVIMKLSACIEAVHECIRRHPETHFHYFENVGTEKEKYISDPEIIAQTNFPYFSLLIIQA